MAKKKSQPYAVVGNIYAVAIKPGLYAVVRLIESSSDGYTFLFMNRYWDAVPRPDDVVEFNLLTYPNGHIKKYWFNEEIPSSFVFISQRELNSVEKAHVGPIGTAVFQSPDHFISALLRDWRWIHDREAMKAEIEALQARNAASELKEKSERKKNLSWELLLSEKLFADYSELWSRKQMAATRAIFRSAIEDLRAGKDRSARRKILKRIVDQLNELEDREEFIETEAREMFVERIEELGKFVGITNKNESLTGHRDW